MSARDEPFVISTFLTTNLARRAGYSLLVLALIDTIASLTPVQWLDPAWELRVMGDLVEKVPVPLLGMLLAFGGGQNTRARWERLVANGLRPICLCMGIAFFLMIPLIATDSMRIRDEHALRIREALEDKLAETSHWESQLMNAAPELLPATFAQIGARMDGKDPQSTRAQLLADAAQVKSKLYDEAALLQRSQQQTLIHSSVKYSTGCLVSALFFLGCWRNTRAVR